MPGERLPHVGSSPTSEGSKGGVKEGGVWEISPNRIESVYTRDPLTHLPSSPLLGPPDNGSLAGCRTKPAGSRESATSRILL